MRWFVARDTLGVSVEQMQDILHASTFSARVTQKVREGSGRGYLQTNNCSCGYTMSGYELRPKSPARDHAVDTYHVSRPSGVDPIGYIQPLHEATRAQYLPQTYASGVQKHFLATNFTLHTFMSFK